MSTVQHYVAALRKGGFVSLAERMKSTQAGALPAKWKLVRHRPQLPPLVAWHDRVARNQKAPPP